MELSLLNMSRPDLLPPDDQKQISMAQKAAQLHIGWLSKKAAQLRITSC